MEDTSELVVISLDGTSERVLLSAPSDTWLEVFAWTSAGELIVEKRVPTANTVHLLLVSSRDGAQTELWNTSQAHYLTAVRESPDANFVAISFYSVADDDRSSRIVLIDRQAVTSTVLMAQSQGIHVLAWEPDGRSILINESALEGSEIRRLSVAMPTERSDPERFLPFDVGPIGVSWDGSILMTRTPRR